jgi:hypothetical protein
MRMTDSCRSEQMFDWVFPWLDLHLISRRVADIHLCLAHCRNPGQIRALEFRCFWRVGIPSRSDVIGIRDDRSAKICGCSLCLLWHGVAFLGPRTGALQLADWVITCQSVSGAPCGVRPMSCPPGKRYVSSQCLCGSTGLRDDYWTVGITAKARFARARTDAAHAEPQ